MRGHGGGSVCGQPGAASLPWAPACGGHGEEQGACRLVHCNHGPGWGGFLRRRACCKEGYRRAPKLAQLCLDVVELGGRKLAGGDTLGDGFVDTTGKVVIAPRFGAAGRFSEGLAAVREKSEWSFIDRSGARVFTVDGEPPSRPHQLRGALG
jgi:hypothetical protein